MHDTFHLAAKSGGKINVECSGKKFSRIWRICKDGLAEKRVRELATLLFAVGQIRPKEGICTVSCSTDFDLNVALLMLCHVQ